MSRLLSFRGRGWKWRRWAVEYIDVPGKLAICSSKFGSAHLEKESDL